MQCEFLQVILAQFSRLRRCNWNGATCRRQSCCWNTLCNWHRPLRRGFYWARLECAWGTRTLPNSRCVRRLQQHRVGPVTTLHLVSVCKYWDGRRKQELNSRLKLASGPTTRMSPPMRSCDCSRQTECRWRPGSPPQIKLRSELSLANPSGHVLRTKSRPLTYNISLKIDHDLTGLPEHRFQHRSRLDSSRRSLRRSLRSSRGKTENLLPHLASHRTPRSGRKARRLLHRSAHRRASAHRSRSRPSTPRFLQRLPPSCRTTRRRLWLSQTFPLHLSRVDLQPRRHPQPRHRNRGRRRVQARRLRARPCPLRRVVQPHLRKS